jgi:hypothetical protein
MRRLQAVPFVVASFALPASAQSLHANFWGSTVDEGVGTSMDEVGDLNGDGYHDMVVGAPGGANSSAIYFVSGKYLQTGNGLPTFGSTFSSPLSSFGHVVVAVGDVTNDGIGDLFVGDSTAVGPLTHRKAAVVSGSSKGIVGSWEAASFSPDVTAVCRYGDYDGDGRTDVLVNSPASFISGGDDVYVLSPRKLVTGSSAVLAWVSGSLDIGFGNAVAAGDFDGDGKPEIVVGAPLWSNDTGRVYIYRGSDQSLMRILSGSSTSKFGSALDASWDIDHDGVKDLIVGAPYSDANGTDAGEAILFSGARIAIGLPFMDIAHWTGTQAGSHFGAAVAMTQDTNGDFRNDVIVAAPEYSTAFPSATNRGAVYWFSGETREQLGRLLGSSGERLGKSLSRAWDYDGDGRFEIAAGAPGSDFGASNAGIMRIAKLFPVTPTTYCTGKVNSEGCTPSIGYTGSPSVSSSSAFNIRATNVINNKNGLLFYSYDASNAAFQGGLLCVTAPTKRTAVQNSGGNPPPNDCSGTMTYDFNARIQSGVDPLLQSKGQEVFCQYWSRDIASPSGTSLSNALRFVINP